MHAPPPPGPDRTTGVNLLGLFQSEKGVGEGARALVRSLAAAGVPHVLNNWSDRGSLNRDTSLGPFSRHNPYPVNLVLLNADLAGRFAREAPGYLRGRWNVGFWNWELEWFPEQWHASFAPFDEVWVPSAFTAASVARAAPIPVRVVPYPVSVPRDLPRGLCRRRFNFPAGVFVFLFAFDFCSVPERKNPLGLVEAFRRAFGRDRRVLLVLKTVHADQAPHAWAEVLTACRGQANIRLLDGVLSREETHALTAAGDAYVALHRAEGYGFHLAEAMALGKPVLATSYSGNVDFMNAANSLPVRYRMVRITANHGPYRRGAVWADPDPDHAAELMRWVVGHPEQARALGLQARRDIERFRSPEAIGALIRERLATAALVPG